MSVRHLCRRFLTLSSSRSEIISFARFLGHSGGPNVGRARAAWHFRGAFRAGWGNGYANRIPCQTRVGAQNEKVSFCSVDISFVSEKQFGARVSGCVNSAAAVSGNSEHHSSSAEALLSSRPLTIHSKWRRDGRAARLIWCGTMSTRGSCPHRESDREEPEADWVLCTSLHFG